MAVNMVVKWIKGAHVGLRMYFTGVISRRDFSDNVSDYVDATGFREKWYFIAICCLYLNVVIMFLGAVWVVAAWCRRRVIP